MSLIQIVGAVVAGCVVLDLAKPRDRRAARGYLTGAGVVTLFWLLVELARLAHA
jgi:hypothetical protein